MATDLEGVVHGLDGRDPAAAAAVPERRCHVKAERCELHLRGLDEDFVITHGTYELAGVQIHGIYRIDLAAHAA